MCLFLFVVFECANICQKLLCDVNTFMILLMKELARVAVLLIMFAVIMFRKGAGGA